MLDKSVSEQKYQGVTLKVINEMFRISLYYLLYNIKHFDHVDLVQSGYHHHHLL